MKTSDIQLLVLPRVAEPRVSSTALAQHRQLLADAPCEVLQIRAGEVAPDACQKILVAAGGGVQSQVAVRWAADLAEAVGAELTGLYVEPNVDVYAQQVGEQILERHLRVRSASEPSESERLVLLNDDVTDAIASVGDQYDLVVLGIRFHGVVHRWLVRGVSEELIRCKSRATLVTLRMATPLASRVMKSIDQTFRNGVPQLAREERVGLVDRIQSSSRWDFDFVALICLSTLIATGGLVQGSTAVVIGAMLVAPLMTPLLGAGLSLVQGNPVLLRHALIAVFRGFLLALALALTIGWLMRWQLSAAALPSRVTSEMAARGAPGILDLAVAFISGIAAAYAIGRPNLLSALPGVAIAAALVPPIATAGLGLAWGQYHLAVGAGLLFLTNIVAIVLGTACSFWSVGIRGTTGRGFFATPTWRTAVAMITILLGLGIYESLPVRRIPHSLQEQLQTFVGRQPDLTQLTVRWANPDDDRLIVDVVSRAPLTTAVEARLAEIVFRHLPASVNVEFQTRLSSTRRTAEIPRP